MSGEADLFIVGYKKSRFIVNYCDCYLDLSLHHMLKMVTIRANTCMKKLMPLLDCIIDNCLIKLPPLLNETSLQMVHVMNSHDTLVPEALPDFVIDMVEIGTIGWPQCWRNESWRLWLEH
jgi:hypothetical protein